eukprot:TRINITY_DN8151_c0_g1_i2.p1 TRINITY_DN8151_c0_g1~~TRINITY_DN8151_c0_g1_i2.p1  ORF type:complete len:274 (+),score=50.16 TRINITY_DN8151_c0_g1_i2:100-822(+)
MAAQHDCAAPDRDVPPGSGPEMQWCPAALAVVKVMERNVIAVISRMEHGLVDHCAGKYVSIGEIGCPGHRECRGKNGATKHPQNCPFSGRSNAKQVTSVQCSAQFDNTALRRVFAHVSDVAHDIIRSCTNVAGNSAQNWRYSFLGTRMHRLAYTIRAAAKRLVNQRCTGWLDVRIGDCRGGMRCDVLPARYYDMQIGLETAAAAVEEVAEFVFAAAVFEIKCECAQLITHVAPRTGCHQP